MPVHNSRIRINRALIVGAESDMRDAYEQVLEDMGIRPHKVTNGLQRDLNPFLSSIGRNDVILCDFHLIKHSYAPYNGDELMAKCFQAGCCGVLCASVSEPQIRRDYLRYIPGLIRTRDPQPDDLFRGWDRCRREMTGDFEPTRHPWRTLVRVDSVDRERRCFHVVVPSWSVSTRVRIHNVDLPRQILKFMAPDRRFHAMVNTGAESASDLFFDGWEP